MTDIDFGATMKTGKKEKAPGNRHYIMILVIILILTLAVSIIVANNYSKNIFTTDTGTTPPNFPETGLSGSPSASSESPPALPSDTGGTSNLPMGGEGSPPALPGFP
jgi:hypothetical protein